MTIEYGPAGKAAIESKTVWANLLIPLLSWGLGLAGVTVPAEVQIAILGLLNVALRRITAKPINRWL